ncbi:MAG: LysR family transcriptional regulator [Burkholderiaceae bacterium]|nr:LysR family transcriptional regulator [Burkholderiaceae bacterium]
MRKLPSLSSLLAFEAAARHLSFTRAATELNVTQGAISQRIKTLEDLLGQLLFVRDGNALRMTDTGIEYLAAIRHVIRDIRSATDRTVNRQRGDVLTIGCLGTFALKCLLPCLGDFRRLYPEIEVRLRTPVPFESSPIHDYDVSIQHGFVARWPHMSAVKLEDEECFPVCSPLLLNGERGLSELSDLTRHTVIRTSSPLVPQDEWPLWLEQAGLPGLAFEAELSCDFLYPCYQAAIDGLGIAMGRTAVVRRDIAAGRLVEPFSIRMSSPLGYHLIVAPDRAELPKVKLFRSWALAALRGA